MFLVLLNVRMAALDEKDSCYRLLKVEPSGFSDGKEQDDEEIDEHVARDC